MLSDGYNVKWKLPKFTNEEVLDGIYSNEWCYNNYKLFGESKITNLLVRFLFKYTKLKRNKTKLFLDYNIGFNLLDEILLPLIHSEESDDTSYLLEDGTIIDCFNGISDKFDYKQRRDFLFLLLKCKYNKEQANSILNYYSRLTTLDYDKLSTLLELNCPDWKEIANRMEYSKDGKVKSTFNFISDVIL